MQQKQMCFNRDFRGWTLYERILYIMKFSLQLNLIACINREKGDGSGWDETNTKENIWNHKLPSKKKIPIKFRKKMRAKTILLETEGCCGKIWGIWGIC